MNLEFKTLEACCISIADGDHQPPPKSESGIPFVTISNISSNQFDFSNTMFVPIEYYSNLDEKRKPHKGDILYSVVGSFGIPVLIKDDAPFVFQRHIAILRPNPQIIDSRFLFYTMLSYGFYAKVDAAAIGAAQRTISLSSLRSIKILLPSLSVQKHIADILSAYDDLIENNQKQIKLLEEAAQRLYKEWFVDLRFPGWENTKIVDGVPEGWEKTTISSVSSVLRRGISPKYNDNATFTVISQKCIRQTIVDFSESRKQEKTFSSEMALIDSDTVICSTGAGTLGRVGQIFGSPTNATFDSHVTLVRTNGRIGAQLLFQSLKDQQTYLQDSGKGSTNQLELSRTTIAECPVFIPSEPVSKHFEVLVQPIHDLISKISQSILSLQNSKDMMLSKLMNENTEEHHAS